MSPNLQYMIFGYTKINIDGNTKKRVSEFTFMSIERQIQDNKNLIKWLNLLNEMQYSNEKITFPDEIRHWEEEELRYFCINFESVDRVYFFKNIMDKEFRLLLRVSYKSKPLYVEAIYSDHFTIRKSITIVTYDAQRFVESIVFSYGKRDVILYFMKYDKLKVQRNWNTVIRLEDLSRIVSSNQINRFSNDNTMIPKIIYNEMINYPKIKKIENKIERRTIMKNKVSKKPRRKSFELKSLLFTQRTVCIHHGASR